VFISKNKSRKRKFHGAATYEIEGVHARERFADILDEQRKVDRCCNDSSRFAKYDDGHFKFYDDAVERMTGYRFSIVMESENIPGYVTEKILNGFLAHTVPIYWGHSDVAKLFNPNAFIWCDASQFPATTSSSMGSSNTDVILQACAARVLEVDQDPALYESYISAPIMSQKQWARFFPWHHSSSQYKGMSTKLQRGVQKALTSHVARGREAEGEERAGKSFVNGAGALLSTSTQADTT
jgi:hypothetical protein